MATCALVESRAWRARARAPIDRSWRDESPGRRGRRGPRRFSSDLAAANPAPKGELQYINPFTLLVAVVLSAQATDAGVNKATPALFAIADTPEKMAALGVEQVAGPDQDHRALSDQGQERHRAFARDRRTARRRDAAQSRGAGGPARRWPQDRQCGAQHRLRGADAGRRHPCLPRRQPPRHRARQDAARGRGWTRCASSRTGFCCTPITG